MSNPLAAAVGAVALENPLMNASGTFGSGKEYADFIDLRELGAVVGKSVTPRPTRGNPPPRLVETAAGMLNAIGLQNEGVDYFLRELLPELRARARVVVANVAGRSEDDYAEVTRRLSGANLDALEINISCPNVKCGGMAFGTDASAAARLTARLRAETPLPLWVKLSPNVTDLAAIARAVEQAGADALVVANTFLGMAIDIEKRRPLLANVTGGLSGAAIHPLALRCVWQVAGAVKCPVIGCGGVTGIREVIGFLLAGATAVQIGMSHFSEPAIIRRLTGELRAWCEAHQTTVREIVGGAREKLQIKN
ncbi:MAG: dihydroorotate dehydrogenase [Planctomycetota bacterium]|jgi:dihydroorotate dehydrogenase (NAD+) catalytic subunit|nr:dihydroorotate dehydrogenase [Planctomycetota bacterium]